MEVDRNCDRNKAESAGTERIQWSIHSVWISRPHRWVRLRTVAAIGTRGDEKWIGAKVDRSCHARVDCQTAFLCPTCIPEAVLTGQQPVEKWETGLRVLRLACPTVPLLGKFPLLDEPDEPAVHPDRFLTGC